jgi:hypothetical protein
MKEAAFAEQHGYTRVMGLAKHKFIKLRETR